MPIAKKLSLYGESFKFLKINLTFMNFTNYSISQYEQRIFYQQYQVIIIEELPNKNK